MSSTDKLYAEQFGVLYSSLCAHVYREYDRYIPHDREIKRMAIDNYDKFKNIVTVDIKQLHKTFLHHAKVCRVQRQPFYNINSINRVITLIKKFMAYIDTTDVLDKIKGVTVEYDAIDTSNSLYENRMDFIDRINEKTGTIINESCSDIKDKDMLTKLMNAIGNTVADELFYVAEMEPHIGYFVITDYSQIDEYFKGVYGENNYVIIDVNEYKYEVHDCQGDKTYPNSICCDGKGIHIYPEFKKLIK